MELKLDNLEKLVWMEPLLIVPYGIETNNERTAFSSDKAFNRTLWN